MTFIGGDVLADLGSSIIEVGPPGRLSYNASQANVPL